MAASVNRPLLLCWAGRQVRSDDMRLCKKADNIISSTDVWTAFATVVSP